MSNDLEVRGVKLRDVYRDTAGDLWEVVALITEPQAVFRRVRDEHTVDHVIGCRNMREQFIDGPMRATERCQHRCPDRELTTCVRERGHSGLHSVGDPNVAGTLVWNAA